VPVAEDRVLLVTDTTLDSTGQVVPASAAARMMGREGELVLVNGQHQPDLTTATGMTERWRVINACTSRVLDLRLDGHRVTQIALDGAYLPAPRTATGSSWRPATWPTCSSAPPPPAATNWSASPTTAAAR
jgi:FtsP/CotA-like multicopper oxidase with cupredoxin domain